MSEQPWEAAMLGDPQRIELMRARIEADEAMMREALEALQESWRTDKGDSAITSLRSRLETK